MNLIQMKDMVEILVETGEDDSSVLVEDWTGFWLIEGCFFNNSSDMVEILVDSRSDNDSK